MCKKKKKRKKRKKERGFLRSQSIPPFVLKLLEKRTSILGQECRTQSTVVASRQCLSGLCPLETKVGKLCAFCLFFNQIQPTPALLHELSGIQCPRQMQVQIVT